MYSDPVPANESLMQFLYQAPIGLVQTTPDGEITMMNPMCARLLMPLSPDGDLGNLFDVLDRVLPDLRYEALARERPGDVICSLRRVAIGPQVQASQAQAPQTLEFSLLRFDDETLIGTVSDATVIVQHEQKRLDSRLRDASRTDNLTSLPNRALILEKIDQALACSRADPAFEFAVVFINADRFNQVNAAFGPAVGDELLRMMAKRMVGAVRLDDVAGGATHPVRTTGRLGGDEFAVVLEGVNCAQVCEIAQRLVDRMSQSYRIADQQLFVSVSVGIVQHLQVWDPLESTCRHASLSIL